MQTTSNALSRAIVLLHASKAQYKIIAADGAEYGDLVVATEPAKKRGYTRNTEFAHGERAAYARAYMEGMKIGDTVTVPYGPYGKVLANNVAAIAQQMWGKQSYITSAVADGIEILKVQ